MRFVHTALLVGLTFMATSAASGDRPEHGGRTLDQRLAGLTPGKPTDCLNNLPSNSTETFGATILYKVNSRLIYRNDTSGGCEGMEHGDYIVTVSNEGRLCRGDIGRTFEPSSRIPTGSCALGAFVPYQRP